MENQMDHIDQILRVENIKLNKINVIAIFDKVLYHIMLTLSRELAQSKG